MTTPDIVVTGASQQESTTTGPSTQEFDQFKSLAEALLVVAKKEVDEGRAEERPEGS